MPYFRISGGSRVVIRFSSHCCWSTDCSRSVPKGRAGAWAASGAAAHVIARAHRARRDLDEIASGPLARRNDGFGVIRTESTPADDAVEPEIGHRLTQGP